MLFWRDDQSSRKGPSKGRVLPEVEQDRIARVILEEIEDEARWQASFAGSQDQLAALAAAAREEVARGDVRDEDPSTSPE